MFLEFGVGNIVEVASGRGWQPLDVAREVRRRIARFERLGLRPGDRVFLPFGNRREFFAELLAIWRLGACAIPVDARLTPFEIATLAAAAKPVLAVIDEETPAPLQTSLLESGLRVVDTSETGTEEASADLIRLDAEALILFTSGSTGNPKGVVHTFRSLAARWISLQQRLGTRDFTRTLCLLPTHFGHGLICNSLFPWLSGNDLFITPPFKPDLIMKLGATIDEHEITFLSSVPSVWKLALKIARSPKKNTLRRAHVGSAPLSAESWSDIRAWTGIEQVCNAYGITETGSWVAGLVDASAPAEDGLIGEGWGAVIKILKARDTDTELTPELECAPGEASYVWLSTPALMRGYFERDDLTKAAVRNGWFLTGDMGFLDPLGRLVLRGRERDEINKGGMKIYPSDVDAVVERFPSCSDVCTFALDDPNYGQSIAMAVVLDKSSDGDIRALFAHMKAQLAEPKMPHTWWLVEAIPRTSRGKINRDAVREACLKETPLELARILSGEAVQ
jgi:acyl-CoA synthetase (AMP-forming)/AMP-acid ligase II